MSIPSTMRAVTFTDGQVRLEQRPVPQPTSDHVLVRVRAAGINNADLLQAAGHYPAPEGWPADILGMELAGEVVDVGSACRKVRVGDRICAVVGGGAQAEYACVPEAVAMPLATGDVEIDWEQAGAFPEAAATAWDALFAQADLKASQRVLITGAAGGVGVLAVQIASQQGAEVVASSRHPQHDEVLRELGAHTVARPDDAHEHGPFDAVLELVGGDTLGDHLGALASRGRIVYIGIGAGRHAQLDLLAVLQKRAIIRGSTLRARAPHEHADIARFVTDSVLRAFNRGGLRVPIQARFALDDVAAAHAEFRRGGKLGKLVLTT